MMRSLLPIVPFLLAALPAQAPPHLRIGTWNLEQFGFRGNPERTAADHQAIADYIRKLGVAVLAVQEIGGEQPLADLCRRIGPEFQSVLGTTGGFSDGNGRVSVGFVYDTSKVRLLQAGELLDLPQQAEGQPIFHRIPVTACFQTVDGRLDFRAITVHFKAGQKPEDFQKRRLEVAALRDWLTALLKSADEDQDVVVLGDFNHSYDAEVSALFQRDGLVRYLKSGKAVDPTIAHFDAPIDMLAVARGFGEVLEATYDVHNEDGLRDKEAWKRTYTDHFPVTVEIGSPTDADPKATFAPLPAEHRLPAVGRRGNAATAPTTRPAPAAPTGGEPLAVGTKVYVVTDHARVTGTLLRPLGNWIVLRDEENIVRAFPVEVVREVRESQW